MCTHIAVLLYFQCAVDVDVVRIQEICYFHMSQFPESATAFKVTVRA